MAIILEEKDEEKQIIGLLDHGIGRDHPIQRAGHAAEHTGRAIYSVFTGNFDRAGAEIRRAGENFGDVSKYAD